MLKRFAETIKKFQLTRLMKMADAEVKDFPNQAQKRPSSPTELKKNNKKKKKNVIQLGQSEGCKRKVAMLVAYNGSGYYGVQVNPGFPTIESELFKALVQVEGVLQDHADNPSKMWFQRGSRTDKGVSASGQIFSLKVVLVPDLVSKLNAALPPQIQVIGYVRTTNSFDSKNFCCSRTYMYMMPTFAFAPIEKFVNAEYRVKDEAVEQVRTILKKFCGTHRFHNFTSGVKYEQPSAKRYIISFECSDPFIREGMEFVTLRVKGQSFMLHQIRKMIGLTIAMVRGYCGDPAMEKSWGPERVDIPKAPGLGLVLEALHFDGYNKRFGTDGLHEPIDWSKHKETVAQFKEEHIISGIVASEKSDRSMLTWLQTLQFHNFDTAREAGPQKPWVKTAKMLALDGRTPDVSEEPKEPANGQQPPSPAKDESPKSPEASSKSPPASSKSESPMPKVEIEEPKPEVENQTKEEERKRQSTL